MEVYLDNSATSWPKPASVVEAMSGYLTSYGASPGRSGHHLALKAAREVFETREIIANFFNADSSDRVVFSANSTLAINIAVNGVLKQGDHVIITHMEHNSVRRPLKHLENEGLIDVTIVPCDSKGNINVEEFTKSFRPNTKLVVTIHGSNVSGTVMPIRKMGEICRSKGVLFMVDAAQTAGFVPIDIQKDNIDILAFTGHKKLYGPPGIGGLCIKSNVEVNTFIHGGSGSKSELDTHPQIYPDRLEAGTPNTVGIIGLKAGLEYVMGKGIESIRAQVLGLTQMLIDELKLISRVKIYGPDSSEERLPLVSVNVDGIVPSELSTILDKEYGIMTRAGLHCSPLAHNTLGTFPQGTVRFSLGGFTTEEQISYTIDAIKKITK